MPLPIAEIITIVAFGLTVGSFAATLLSSTKSKILYVVLVASFAAISVTAVALIWQQEQHSSHVKNVSRKIVSTIGSGQKTADELLSELYPEDYGTVSEALALLLKSDTVGDKVVEVTDGAGLRHSIRVYFVGQ